MEPLEPSQRVRAAVSHEWTSVVSDATAQCRTVRRRDQVNGQPRHANWRRLPKLVADNYLMSNELLLDTLCWPVATPATNTRTRSTIRGYETADGAYYARCMNGVVPTPTARLQVGELFQKRHAGNVIDDHQYNKTLVTQ